MIATYRVQLHAAFAFRDAQAIVPYLQRLGVSHLYTSPILAARKGSRHGYDVTDPTRVNPELGTIEALRALSAALHERGMGLLVDIVPNHMGASQENPFWEDVLTHGERSPFARWFDIDWGMHPDRRIVLPVLRDDLDAVIARGELTVAVSESGARLVHFGASFPVSPDGEPETLQLAQWDPAAAGEAQHLYAGPGGAARLHALLDAQHYRLTSWRAARREINYRRFFDVNELVALRAEDPEVFRATHELTLALVADGTIDALRVDHVDGLRDPAGYLERLRNEVDARRTGVPIVVEKILMYHERLRLSWCVDGTTGYERLNDLEDLFVHPTGFATIERRYRAARRRATLTFADTVRADKRAVLERSFGGEMRRVARLLDAIVARDGATLTREPIYHGIGEFIAALPVYRTYITTPGVIDQDDAKLLAPTGETREGGQPTVAEMIRAICRGALQPDAPETVEFIARLQQLSAPAMAKGLEDTAHYAYVPLVSRNEVGGAPDRPLDDAVAHFHEINALYAARWPRSLVATTTHDTKRSADSRARISALSEMPDEWHRSVTRWRRLNRHHQTVVRGRVVPDTNAELFFYQTLIGIWPSPRAGRRADDVPDRAWRTSATDRLTLYMTKAVREAKLRTTWTDPDVEYESALLDFVRAVLSAPDDDPFLSDVGRLVSRIAPVAYWSSLARELLRFTIPGVPDIYQGDETWNFALVDPDNRRPVDYASRRNAIDALTREPAHASPGTSGAARLNVVVRALAARRDHAELFAGGSYAPLAVRGQLAHHVVAFARTFKDEHAVVLAPRLVGPVLDQSPVWETRVSLPESWRPATLECAITGRRLSVESGDIVMRRFPDDAFGLFVG